jgi:hypothetical protein
MTGNSPRDCIIVKAALYPPACPTLIRKSRLLRLIFEPPSIFPKWPYPANLDGRIGIFRIADDVGTKLRHGSAESLVSCTYEEIACISALPYLNA